ncbi:MAG: SET domain-containing protein-lysine N-methyltransferase [Minisyncoccia bacterium]
MKRVYVKESSIQGRGLYASESIPRGKIIERINGARVRRRPRSPHEAKRIMNWVGIGKETWIKTAGTPFRYINHSCEPNAAIIGTKTVIAVRNIKKDEEISIDYSMTDADPLWSMKCSCGSKKCRKVIASIQSVPASAFKRHMPHIPRNFQRIYIKSHVLNSR